MRGRLHACLENKLKIRKTSLNPEKERKLSYEPEKSLHDLLKIRYL